MKRRDGVRRRGKVWYIRIPLGDGKRQEEPTTARSRKEAKDIREKRLVELREGLYHPDAARTRVFDLLEDVKRDYRLNGQNEADVTKRWKHLGRVFGNDLASAVTKPRMQKYIEGRLAEGAAPGTAQREIACLRRMLRLGFEAGKVTRLPHFPSITVNNVRKGFFERDAFERLRDELPEYLKVFVIVGYWTGWRKGELLALERRRHVDLGTGTLRLDADMTKNGEARLVYLQPEALEALRQWDEKTKVLERSQGIIVRSLFHHDGEAIHDFYAAWRSACNRANLSGALFHDFRRTAARNYRRSGEDESVIMKILGHKTREIFKRYNIVNEDDLRRAAERVTAVSNGAKTGQIIAIDFVRRDRDV
jgi:integrase